ncbi:MAG: 2-hydroxyacyl-CoA dehydratase [Blautia sp.]|nr:2-hydroxyacyl-CoA dehydratase [Blautia sp.]
MKERNMTEYDQNRILSRQQERFDRKGISLTAKMLRQIRELTHMPASLEPFLNTLEQIFALRRDVQRPRGVPTIGTYCVMVPPEIIYAQGAMPVKLCSGSYTAFGIGDDKAPRDACPLVKAVMGFEEIDIMPVYQNCALMAIPVTCDCKKKLAGWLLERRPTSILHVPSNRESDADMEQFTEELYSFSRQLSRITGIELTYSNLVKACRMTSDAQVQLSRFISLRRKHPLIIKGTFSMAVMNAISYTWLPDWTRQLSDLNDELEVLIQKKEMAVKENQPRILLTGSPVVFPNFKLPLLIESMGGLLGADETCMGERGFYDPPAVVDQTIDGMMRAFSNRSTRPCTCPTFTDNDRRIYRIRQLIRDYRIQGVVYHVLRGCLVYDYEYAALEEEMGKLGIPIIRVETDYNEEDVEQLRIRIEAFIELIKYKI